MLKIFTMTNVEICILLIQNIVKILSACAVLLNRFFIAVKCAYLTLFNGNARILFIIISWDGMAKRHCRNTIIQKTSKTNAAPAVLLCQSLRVYLYFRSYFCIYTTLKCMFTLFFSLFF